MGISRDCEAEAGCDSFTSSISLSLTVATALVLARAGTAIAAGEQGENDKFERRFFRYRYDTCYPGNDPISLVGEKSGTSLLFYLDTRDSRERSAAWWLEPLKRLAGYSCIVPGRTSGATNRSKTKWPRNAGSA